jgi:hypothetical protein
LEDLKEFVESQSRIKQALEQQAMRSYWSQYLYKIPKSQSRIKQALEQLIYMQ